MLTILLVLALAFLLIGLTTVAKWALIIAAVLAIIAVVDAVSGGRLRR